MESDLWQRKLQEVFGTSESVLDRFLHENVILIEGGNDNTAKPGADIAMLLF